MTALSGRSAVFGIFMVSINRWVGHVKQ